MNWRSLWRNALVLLAAGLLLTGSMFAQPPFNASYTLMPFYGDYFLHDPSPVITNGASYFIYGDGQGISGITSTDLRNWTGVSPVFTTVPAWTTNAVPGFTGYYWAPDVAYFNGRYNMYYAASDWGTINSVIGLVTSPSLISPVWTDQGKVIQSNPSGQTTTNTDITYINCIDPSILQDTNGTIWMSFGSYSDGIMIMQLNPTTGLRISTNEPLYRVANNGPVFFSSTEEGTFLYQWGGYYYLFCNWGGCCAGVDSTYNIRVGRATTVTGPYFDKNGVNLINGGGTMVLESSARYIGPGQAGIINLGGTNWFTFHYYDGNNNGAATVGMNQIYWDTNGWPVITNDWSAYYPFQVDAREHRDTYNGSLRNGAAITNDPSFGKVLGLNGTTQYALLANPVANASTFAAWVKWNGGAAWQRIFDFGAGTNQYLFLTPSANTGLMRFAITTNGNATGHEQQINAAIALPTNSWCHVAVTLNGTNGILYLDGNPIASNTDLTIRPWQVLATSNFVGESQYPADPGFNGDISSFRIFARALSAAEISALAETPPSLAERYSFNTNSPSAGWDSVGMAHGLLMGNAIVNASGLQLPGQNGSYVNLPGGILTGSSALSLECWADFGANGFGAQLVDFGNTNGSIGTYYFSFSPHTSLGGQQMESSGSTTAALNIPGPLDDQSVYLACIVDPANSYAAIYTNGVLEGSLSGSWPLLDTVNPTWSFIGRSLYASDAPLDATISELRLHDGRLTPQEIAFDYAVGPDELSLPVTLNSSLAGSSLVFSWPSWALGYNLVSSSTVHGLWTLVSQTPVLSNNQWSVTIPMTNAVQFYQLER
jgi:arabinan endo-1,5-alpha-L-arabinosidase